MKFFSLLIFGLFFTSCVLTHHMAVDAPQPQRPFSPAPEIENDRIILTVEDLLISEDFGNPRIVEIYRDEIQDNSERKFLDLMNYYKNGELLAAKILFDNLLETLEYLYGDNKVSDTAMLENFWSDFSNQSVKRSVDILEVYSSLFSDENLFERDRMPGELVIEQISGAVPVKQNNDAFLYLEAKINELLSQFGKKGPEEFIKTAYDNYYGHLTDRIGVREMYIRSQKYSNFINVKLKENGIPSIFGYIPAVMTSFYEGPRNGSIWRLENIREFRNIRNNTGASTAEVISKIKSLRTGKNDLEIVSSVFEQGKYSISPSEVSKDIFTDAMANFFALAIILQNPSDHDLITAPEISDTGESAYFTSYEEYIKDPKKFASAQPATRQPAATRQSTSGSSSFIRINYKVQRGDNLDKIANLFGVTVAQLKQWNPKDTSKKYLYPGMTLYVRGDNFQYYTAKSGDSIGKITSRYKMTLSEFKQINELSSNTVYKGRKYIVKK